MSVRPRMKPPNTLLLHCSSLLISTLLSYRCESFWMAGTPGRHRARTALSAGGSDTHVEPKPEARGACECSAANEAAQHVALAPLSSSLLISFACLSL